MTAPTLTDATDSPWSIERPGDYRLLATVIDTDGAISRAREQVAAWFREKRFDVDLGASGHHRIRGSELTLVSRSAHHARQFRFRLQERNNAGHWRTEFTAHVAERSGAVSWVQLNVGNSEGEFAVVPRLARYLMDVLPLQDGLSQLASHPITVGTQGIDALIDALCDPERHGLILVAGTTSDSPFDPFQQNVQVWTQQVVGLAQVVVLDPLATHTLNTALGESHAVQPWTIRTFLPHVDPASPIDGRRHRTLGAQRLADDATPRITKLLGWIAREHAAQRILPNSVIKVSRALSRQEDRELLHEWPLVPADRRPTTPDESSRLGRTHTESAAAVPVEETAAQPVVAPTNQVTQLSAGLDIPAAAEQYLRQLEAVKKILGIDRVDETTLRGLRERLSIDQTDLLERINRQLNERQQRIETLEDQLGNYKQVYEEEELDHAVTTEARDQYADEVRWLRSRLAEAQDFTAAYSPLPDSATTQYPRNFEALVEALPTLAEAGVIFTGDPKVTRRLDDVDDWGKAVQMAWDSLLTLADYMRARATGQCDGGVARYLEEPASRIPPHHPKTPRSHRDLRHHAGLRPTTSLPRTRQREPSRKHDHVRPLQAGARRHDQPTNALLQQLGPRRMHLRGLHRHTPEEHPNQLALAGDSTPHRWCRGTRGA